MIEASTSPPIVWQIIHRTVVSSTMDELRALSEGGAPEGTVVVADHQTAGRGRAGRVWVSAPGAALQCSVLLRPDVPPDRLPALSLVVGVAVAGALESFGMTPRLKWPNDVWLDGHKVAGILVSTRIGVHAIEASVGIGINVASRAANLPPGATSILAATGNAPDRDMLLIAVLERLGAGYASFVSAAGRPDLAGWISRAALLGDHVEIRDGTAAWRGLFAGIDRDGALLLRDDTGNVQRIVAGDLTRGPRRSAETG